MKIIIISEKDAANISLGRIANEFINQGHIVNLYAVYTDESVLRYFSSSIARHSIHEMTEDVISCYDMIFCSTLVSVHLPECVFTARKPIFTHNYLMNRQINWGGDICFVPSQKTVESDYDEYMQYSYIGIGDPKYDGRKTTNVIDVKRFLFIDSGHYPFSTNGKRELARTLLNICRLFPDYELVVKPRFLPGDKVVTHRNDIHLYDILNEEANGCLPINLVLLYEHKDLMNLINECCTVISMYSTAFVGAIVANKGLICLENLPTTDVYDIRHKTFMRNRENIVGSGALIDYHEVDKLLPQGKKGENEYLSFLLEEKEDVAGKIVEVCTYLWKTFFSKNEFPVFKDTVYKHYKMDYQLDPSITWERIISNRCYDYILLKSLILIDFHVNAKLDIDYILEKINEYRGKDGLIDVDKFKGFLREVNLIRDNCIIENCNRMVEDPIDAGILLNAYYLQKRYDEIRCFPQKDIAAFNMFRAFVAYEVDNDVDETKKELIIFFDKCVERRYNIEISDMSNNKFKAYEMLINVLMEKGEVLLASEYLKKMSSFYASHYYSDEFEEPTEASQKKHFDFIENMRKRVYELNEEY